MVAVIVGSGTWIYAGVLPKPVDIIGLSYDFWYERFLLDEPLKPDEKPSPLGDDRLLYYVRLERAGDKSKAPWAQIEPEYFLRVE